MMYSSNFQKISDFQYVHLQKNGGKISVFFNVNTGNAIKIIDAGGGR